ncbi:unnamed protein product [Schistosoma mattheei]|uniref:Uncharacterized protein n=1 Tax=Schistosoma mattheei TaxID=31246 RepID=A0A183NXQ4_9TREM|nr:unnamed protein product [Schistosoma mattheei]
MEFNRNTIRQAGYFTPTYSNSPNVKRHQDLLSNYQSESYGLNYLTQLQMAHNFPTYHHRNITNTKYMGQSNYDNDDNNHNNLNTNPSSHNNCVRINHTLDGKTQIIYETPSRTRQYWLDRCKLPSTNYIDNNDDNTMNFNKIIPIKPNYSTYNTHSQLASSKTTTLINKNYSPIQSKCKLITSKFHNSSLDKYNNKSQFNTTDMYLYELTDNELILSKLDPRINIKTNENKLIDNNNQQLNSNRKMKDNDILPIYQPIEQTIYQFSWQLLFI